MTKGEPKDPRSTYRKRARKVLQAEVDAGRREFKCANCGYVPTPPLSRSNNLDVNHVNKVISDNDPANLEYLCRDCHYDEDRQTAKGEMSQSAESKMYGEGFFL